MLVIGDKTPSCFFSTKKRARMEKFRVHLKSVIKSKPENRTGQKSTVPEK